MGTNGTQIYRNFLANCWISKKNAQKLWKCWERKQKLEISKNFCVPCKLVLFSGNSRNSRKSFCRWEFTEMQTGIFDPMETPLNRRFQCNILFFYSYFWQIIFSPLSKVNEDSYEKCNCNRKFKGTGNWHYWWVCVGLKVTIHKILKLSAASKKYTASQHISHIHICITCGIQTCTHMYLLNIVSCQITYIPYRKI